jgi:hypothetical protein
MLIGFPAPTDRISVWRHADDGDLIVVDPEVRHPTGAFLRFYSEAREDERGILRRSARTLLEPVPFDSGEHRRACARYARYRARQGAGTRVAAVAGQPRDLATTLAQAMLPAFDVTLPFELVKRDDSEASRVRADAWAVAGDAPECLIGARDLELVMGWFDDDERRRVREGTKQAAGWGRKKQDDDFSRLLSARVAEKALARFFEKAGRTVVDVSIQQVGGPRDGDWNRYDLWVDGIGIDVKNARMIRPRLRASRPSRRYVSHSIAEFKQERDGADVRIAGVLSSYVPPVALGDFAELHGRETWPAFLGETTWTRISLLRARFDHQAFDRVDALRTTGRAGYLLPSWIFDYPAWLYRTRDEALATVANELRRDGWGGVRTGHVPVSIATGVPVASAVLDHLPEWQARLYGRLLQGTQTAGGPSLPFVFLGLVEHFLGVLDGTVSVPLDFSPQQYADLVFYRPARRENPAGLHDPLRTVATLISSLATLWDGLRGGPRYRFLQLELTAPGILRGLPSAREPWRTLLAYCGDCGNDPLIYGVESWCTACWWLRCRACGACSPDCGAAYHVPGV